MGRRARQRSRLRAPPSDYTDPDGNVLTLRGSLTAGSRQQIAAVPAAGAGSLEDAWQRAFELLFERLAVRWVIAGAPAIEAQAELLARLRIASARERAWVRETLRAHCAEHFPDVDAP